uniref:Ribonuclease P/MRP subunit p30 n=1 Tax=Anas platyrhynchos TaxID=8839 RepID=A0A8B9TBC3_ANAPL
MAGFADLNVPQGPDKKGLQSLLEAAARLGYSAVALNHVIDFKEKKQEIAKPVSPSELFPSLPIVQGTSKQLKVLTRLTLVVSDPSHCNLLRSTSSNIRLYDIIAVFPKTEKLFHNIVISSAAERPLELRGPYDVANLGLLFGLSESEAKAAVSTNCRATILHGETRKSACGVVYTVKKLRKVEEEETVPACKKAKTQA